MGGGRGLRHTGRFLLDATSFLLISVTDAQSNGRRFAYSCRRLAAITFSSTADRWPKTAVSMDYDERPLSRPKNSRHG